MSQHLNRLLQTKLQQRQQQEQIRQRLVVESAQAKVIVIDGKEYLNFASNDYLGLANHPQTLQRFKQAVDQYGFGSGGSHLIAGHSQAHKQLETAVADFLQRDAALSFSSGYMANLALLQSLAQKGDLIIADKLNHASLIDGVKLSEADGLRYSHCDMQALERRLKQAASNAWVVTDSVFSMDGDIAPLHEICWLCDKYQATLIVDDAHGFGLLGDNGRGCIEHFGLSQKQLPVLMATFAKAVGGFGAFVSGSQLLIDYLVQFARSYIYTTAMPSAIAIANISNLQQITSRPELRAQLQQNIELFKAECLKKQIGLLPSQTAIQPIPITYEKSLNRINQQLKNVGILVGAIRPPTVPANGSRLRITLTAAHNSAEIIRLVQQLAKFIH